MTVNVKRKTKLKNLGVVAGTEHLYGRGRKNVVMEVVSGGSTSNHDRVVCPWNDMMYCRTSAEQRT